MSLDQAFAHCPIFSAAATRRCLDRVAVPVLGNKLSLPLTVIALVGCYPANKLIVRRLIINRFAPLLFGLRLRDYRELPRLSTDYARVNGRYLRVTNPFATSARALREKILKSQILNSKQIQIPKL
jgi:hypothetical protein